MNRELPPALRRRISPSIPKLALSSLEAAEALGISVRTLYLLPDIPRVHLGRRVLYPVKELEAWLTQRCESPAVSERAEAETSRHRLPTPSS